ncbi:hypothetical protein PVAP13_2KG166516 [Panicum virgatum]|uniref:Uncharacterized protein n=1 Tax=Panicum virgatum TaxID=38727 RepID=A0A8T0W776_PANVG|nr:hypothetical protein PVAP13_2KG166516 [Panicum virgatum]
MVCSYMVIYIYISLCYNERGFTLQPTKIGTI